MERLPATEELLAGAGARAEGVKRVVMFSSVQFSRDSASDEATSHPAPLVQSSARWLQLTTDSQRSAK